MKCKHYDNSGSMGNTYVFGINLYRHEKRLTLDIIIGKHVFVIYNKHKGN